MRVYISYSHKDKPIVERIAARLKVDGYNIWLDSLQLHPGDNIVQKVEEGLREAEALIVVISTNSLHSKWVHHEYSAIALQQISKGEKKIFPIRIDESTVPSYLADRVYIDFSKDFENGLNLLSEALRKSNVEPVPSTASDTKQASDTREDQVQRLHESLRHGLLTLVCGAGVSVGAGIPAWGSLLVRLLDSMIDRIANNKSLNLSKKAVADLQKAYGGSSLILGKYLKNNLGRDFPKEVRNALYSSNTQTSPLIDSIVDLSRPQRDGRALDSIITFNFDCLTEDGLTANSIQNKPIYSESIRHDPNQLPIYHVHGYLPKTGKIPTDMELVFSEDAYHTQFIDPFSWSNLIQLNKLTQNVCFFIGISLTDPNMRRLLDVAWRKNPEKTLGHYIAKKRPKSGDNKLDEVSIFLEEQDANALGLNVIWIEDYDELPTMLRQIAMLQ